MSFQPVIGLEVHAQISVLEKLFSRAPSTVFGKEPNSCVSWVDAGYPGMLPVLNPECLYRALPMAFATCADIADCIIFERKHYFYPDLPSGYQISQYQCPLIQGGHLEIECNDALKTIHLDRIHIEQDAGQIHHDQAPDVSFINLNRAGIALMEIVTKPELSSPEEAVIFIKTLRSLMRYLGVCQGDMEKGQLRVDANISIHRPNEPLGNRVEIKNMNSLKFLEKALYYEIERQTALKNQGQEIVQETRTYHVASGKTRSMRMKENAPDYLYFPEPDLPLFRLNLKHIQVIKDTMPELPWARKKRFESLGLSAYNARLLTAEKEVADYFETALDAMEKKDIKLLANWICGDLFALFKMHGENFEKVSPKAMAELLEHVMNKHLTPVKAKEALGYLWTTGTPLETLIHTHQLEAIEDEALIHIWVAQVLEENPSQVKEYLLGKEKLFGYLFGKLMQKAEGKALPETLRDVLKKMLSQ